MGLFDLFSGKINCPDCGSPGAKKSGGRVLCPNASCPNFDSEVAAAQRAAGAPPSPSAARPASAALAAQSAGAAPVDGPQPMGTGTILVRYRNFQGAEKTFSADPDSARRRGNHISLCIAPKGIRVSLARERIQNLSEVEAVCSERVAEGQARPTPVERQVLAYHKKHGTTSARYESARAKYPDW
jgi:hypothetical protein